jgi:hypothetical protein
MKSSFHSLTSILLLFCNCQFRRLDTIQFLSSYPSKLASRNSIRHSTSCCWTLLYDYFARTTQKTAYIVMEACFLILYLAMNVLFLRAFASAGMCFPSRCLTMGIHVTMWICYHLIREPLGTSCPYGGRGGGGWSIVAAKEKTEPQEDFTSRTLGEEGMVTHR